MKTDSVKDKSVLYVGQAFYNHWYLSRELRKLGWKADQLNLDCGDHDQMFYHGQDFWFKDEKYEKFYQKLDFFLYALDNYSVFHFANTFGILFIEDLDSKKPRKKSGFVYFFFNFLFNRILNWELNKIYRLVYFIGIKRTARLMIKFSEYLPERWDILLIKKIGKTIVYTNNGCQDGVLQSSFGKWSTPDNVPVCDICPWKNNPAVCSDERMRKWGEFRNSVTDYLCLTGGNRADFNVSDRVHERPEVYCLDHNFWDPAILVPSNYKLPFADNIVKIFHSVGNFQSRSQVGNKTIKSTHVYVPLLEKLKKQGFPVEMIFFNDVPSIKMRYYQVQADIVVDMLTFGFFGANIREGMMLGKPCVCYIRPEWLEQIRKEIPEYADELPVISATPDTIEAILIDLINNPEKRREIGRRSRKFAEKWHRADKAAIIFDKIYSDLVHSN